MPEDTRLSLEPGHFYNHIPTMLFWVTVIMSQGYDCMLECPVGVSLEMAYEGIELCVCSEAHAPTVHERGWAPERLSIQKPCVRVLGVWGVIQELLSGICN